MTDSVTTYSNTLEGQLVEVLVALALAQRVNANANQEILSHYSINATTKALLFVGVVPIEVDTSGGSVKITARSPFTN